MSKSSYFYENQKWEKCVTVPNNNSFFHATFGHEENGRYFDMHAEARRWHWLSFLSFYQKEQMSTKINEELRKCMAANEKHRNVCDQYTYEDYINDVKSETHFVKLEEIPVLATLENIHILVFSHGKSTPILEAKANNEIRGAYPYVAKRMKGKILLCLEGNEFIRLKPIDIKTNTKNVTKGKNEKYLKEGDTGIGGTDFQIDILIVVMLNAFIRPLDNWKLKTEDQREGKFNDIVLKWKGNAVIIQTKHKMTPKERKNIIKLDQLIKSTDDDFCLPKYFKSYLDIKSRFRDNTLQNMIICTNAVIDGQTIQEYMEHIQVDSENLLHLPDTGSYYKFKDNIFPILKEKVMEYYRYSGGNYSNTNDDDLKDFLKKLQFFSEYPSKDNLQRNIDKVLYQMVYSKCVYGTVSCQDVRIKMREWFQRKKDVPLGDNETKGIFFEVWKDLYFKTLNNYDIFFRNDDTQNLQSHRVVHIFAENRNLLQEIKIYRSLPKEHRSMVLGIASHGNNLDMEVIRAFEIDIYTHLIVIWPKLDDSQIKVAAEKLNEILVTRPYKKLILVDDDNNKFIMEVKFWNNVEKIILSTQFDDFTDYTKTMIVTKKLVNFQGNIITLDELLDYQAVINSKFLDSEVVIKLIKNDIVYVGKSVQNLKNSDVDVCYIPRKFKKKVTKQYSGNFETHNFDITVLEDDIYNHDEKVILIADTAGMGKSTVLKKLSADIKKTWPLLWVVQLELQNYFKIFEMLCTNKDKPIDIIDILDNGAEFSQLERLVFSKVKKIVMFDGVEEITVSSAYKDCVLNLVTNIKENPSVEKLFITTRQHIMTEELIEKLKVEPFTIEPFTESEQIGFLIEYWTNKLGLVEKKQGRCKIYAESLINRMKSWIFGSVQNHFGAIPLQVRMLAEIFQHSSQTDNVFKWEGCKEFLYHKNLKPILPEDLNIAELYDMFIEKKRSIFINRLNPVRIATTDVILGKVFNQYRLYHRHLALNVVLTETECHLFSTYKNIEDIDPISLDIGIIDKNSNFIHRTFAEYIVAEVLLCELQISNQKESFQEFLLETVLWDHRFLVVRAFFNSVLKPNIDLLPSDIFEIYQASTFEDDFKERLKINLIHRLAAEGHVSILKLLFKCINFKKVENKTFWINDWSGIPQNTPRNTINALKSLISGAGVNIINDNCQTPLHCAVEQGYLEMTEYLVDQGASIDSDYLESVLHLAIQKGHTEIVKFLINKGANVTLENAFGLNAIDLAVQHMQAPIVEHILNKVCSQYPKVYSNVQLSYSVFYASAYSGNHKILAKMVERVGLNLKDKVKGKPLIFAAVSGLQVDTVNYLIERDCNINEVDEEGNTVLHIVARNSFLNSMVDELLRLEANPNIQNQDKKTPLHIAAEESNMGMIELLVKKNAEINVRDNWKSTPLHIAINHDKIDIIKYLINIADVTLEDKNGNTPLHCASFRGQHTIVKVLVEKWLNGINKRNQKGYMPLHLAAIKGHLDIVNFFIFVCMMNVDVTDNDQNTVVHLAVSKNHLKIVKALLSQHDVQINFNLRNRANYTPLQLAVTKGYMEIVQLFVSMKPDLINVTDNKGNTVLHLAAEKCLFNVVKFLVCECKIDVNSTNDDKRTALHLVMLEPVTKNYVSFQRSERYKIIQFLSEQGTKYDIMDKYGKTPALLLDNISSIRSVS